MTRDEQLLGPAQAALDCITTWQHPDTGGWHYSPFRADGRLKQAAGDTSISSWNVMALKSGQMAGLKVNPASLKKADAFLESMATENGAKYWYTDNEKASKKLKIGSSTAGLLTRMYLGMKKTHPALQAGVQFVAAQEKSMNEVYFAYKATQIMHHVQGPAWDAWNVKMQATLLPAQATNGHERGSWEEGLNYGWWNEHGGRLYITSLATMMLEVYYRHMSIYDTKSTGGEFKD
jgi:hypothetical protein